MFTGCQISDSATVTDVTLKAAYLYGEEWLNELVVYLKGNVDFAADYIQRELPYLKMIKPEGSFLLWLDFRGTGLTHEEKSAAIAFLSITVI